MPGKSSSERSALEAQNAVLLRLFEQAGYEFIQPDILQPADIFLERSGENIRSRTFLFTDPDGRELCLRPDLTVPACRYHLEQTDVTGEARYCYAGPAFRHQPGAVANSRPVEFDQAGIEYFGAPHAQAADVEVLSLAVHAVRAAGLREFQIRLGDPGMFHALLDSIEMPLRWRRRLKHHYWRPAAFRDLIERLTGRRQRAQTSISALIDQLGNGTLAQAVVLTEAELAKRNLPLVGGRSIAEIAGRLAEKANDRVEPRLKSEDAQRIDDYLKIEAPLARVTARLKTIADGVGPPLTAAVENLAALEHALQERKFDTGRIRFSAVFGRNLEYYTGFVFQIEANTGNGPVSVAGGGRYDNLLRDIGAPSAIPAVGCAIHTERLLEAVGRQT